MNLSGKFTNGDPGQPFHVIGHSFLWSRDSQQLVGFLDDYIGAREWDPFESYSSVVISLPGEGTSGYQDGLNFDSIVTVSIDATTVVFTPYAERTLVPELSSYSIVAGLLISGFIFARRCVNNSGIT